jgi:hydroxymethylbilane synthase
MPLSAFATLSGGVMDMRAAWGDPDGVKALVLADAQGAVTDESAADALGTQVAQALQARVASLD